MPRLGRWPAAAVVGLALAWLVTAAAVYMPVRHAVARRAATARSASAGGMRMTFFEVEVDPSPEEAALFLSLLAGPPVLLLLFWLRARRSAGGRGGTWLPPELDEG